MSSIHQCLPWSCRSGGCTLFQNVVSMMLKKETGKAVCFLVLGISLPFPSWCCNEISCRVPIGLISHPHPLKIAVSEHYCFPRKSLYYAKCYAFPFKPSHLHFLPLKRQICFEKCNEMCPNEKWAPKEG